METDRPDQHRRSHDISRCPSDESRPPLGRGCRGRGLAEPGCRQTWRARWSKQDVLNVGALALDPTNPNHLYCGTGEANLSADSYPGVGLYHSTNGGTTWRLLAASQ